MHGCFPAASRRFIPLGAVIFSWMLARSAIATLLRGGVVWRDTFYPIDELRKGLV
jgi:hypothetical protein